MVNDFEVIHMGGRTYNPILGRFMQADPFVQAPGNLQNYNRYSYVLNNPMSYTDPSGYFFKKLGKFVKKYWKAAVAIGVTIATYGAASGWAASWGMTQGFSMTVMGATQSFVTGLSVAGAMTAGAIAGAAGGFVGGALNTKSLTGALRGAVAGSIAGAAGGYANFGSVGGWEDVTKRVTASAIGGCGAGKVSGGSCNRGAKLAAIAQTLNIAINKFTTEQPTYATAQKGQVIKQDPDIYTGTDIWNPCLDICDATTGEGGSTYAHVGIANVTNDIPKLFNENGKLLGPVAKYVPGMNSGAVFHDVLVGTAQRAMGIWNTNHGGYLGMVGRVVTNQLTIVPAIGANYVALGVTSYGYYYQGAHHDN